MVTNTAWLMEVEVLLGNYQQLNPRKASGIN